MGAFFCCPLCLIFRLLRSGVTVPSAVSQLVSHIKQFVLLSDDASASQQRSPKIQGRALFEGLKGLEDSKVRELLEFGESVPRETPVDTCCELLVRRCSLSVVMFF